MTQTWRKQVMLVSLLGSAVAQAQVQVPQTWQQLLQPTPQERQQACDDAVAYERAHPSPPEQKYVSSIQDQALLRGKRLIDDRLTQPAGQVPPGVATRVIVQLPAYSVGVACANAEHHKEKLEPKQVAEATLFYVQGEVTLLKDALKNTAFLRLLDKGGKELYRLKAYSTPAEPALWERQCRENVCRWQGFSVFRFNDYKITPEVYSATNTLEFVFNRGYGEEIRRYQAGDFTQVKLEEPK